MNRAMSLAVVALALAGCSGAEHLSKAHGRAYRAFFERQRAVPTPPFREAEKGLDAQEAAIIAGAYRQSLAPAKVGQRQEPQVLLIDPEAAGGRLGRPPPLAPSVPKE